MAKQSITNGESGLSARNKINENFTELYNAIPSPIKLNGVNANTIQEIQANTFIDTLSVNVVSGSPLIKIGTVSNAADIVDEQVFTGFNKIQVDKYYSTTQNIYITISGGVVNIRIDVLNSYN